MIKNDLTYISLFSCAGIGCLGFTKAGFKCIATNELLPRRLDIQKYNNKCIRPEGYILGDITLPEVKEKIFTEIEWWKSNRKIDSVDVVIATPPCQGMSIFNHKKKETDIIRNSLVIESMMLVKKIQPKFFVFENVPSFMDTVCLINKDERCSIREAHNRILSNEYIYYAETINFKLYGSKSSRTRTIVIGVRKNIAQYVSPIEMFPDRESETTLRETIGMLPSLRNMGEISSDDIFHAFRTYPEYMRAWISDLAEGQSAFDNEDSLKRPYRIDKAGNIIENANKTGDKYRRQVWDKVAMSIHTRNDQLASQNTIHPVDDRVFSIRELMKMMTIPDDFMWSSIPFAELNSLPLEQKRKFLKKEETNIRQCIGEAVPTEIFQRIATKISLFLKENHYQDIYIRKIIEKYSLRDFNNLTKYIDANSKRGQISEISVSTLSRIAELANNARSENAAYYTGKDTLTEIFQHLPIIEKDEIRILEPAVGAGNFIPFLIHKYSYAKKLIVDVIDIDATTISICKKLETLYNVPNNVTINYICADFISYDFGETKYDLIIGNPPYLKLSSKTPLLEQYRTTVGNRSANNLAAFFIEKSLPIADIIAFVLPKNFLCNTEYKHTREKIRKKNIAVIEDFGEYGFRGVHIETIFILINTNKKAKNTFVKSLPKSISLQQKQCYITDEKLPNWIIYRSDVFDEVLFKKTFGCFSVFRDRQITKSFTSNSGSIWIVRSRNIPRTGEKLEHRKNYDIYMNAESINNFEVSKYLNRTDVFLVPNMTYYPRMIKKPAGVVPNGSVAVLELVEGYHIDEDGISYIASDEFEQFYRIARNHATRSLNIDNVFVYYFCI